MQLTNEFRVGVPISEAWALLTDVERIAPCMPGAELQEIEGDEYRGVVKVKVGPITAQYKGKATFLERDEAGGVAVLRAEGRDTRGQGNANATITAALVTDGDGTKVTVTTDLTVTGRVAEFGRGVLADVSGKLLGQFVDCLETNVLGAAPPPAATATESGSVAGATVDVQPASPSSPPSPTAAGPLSDTDAGTASAVAVDIDAAAAPGSNGASATSPVPPSQPDAPSIRRIESAPAQPVDLLDAAGGSVAKRLIVPAVIALVVILLVRRRRRRR